MAYIKIEYSAFLEKRTSIQLLIHHIADGLQSLDFLEHGHDLIISAQKIDQFLIADGKRDSDFFRIHVDLDHVYTDDVKKLVGSSLLEIVSMRLQPIFETSFLILSIKIQGLDLPFYRSNL